ncbi:hypothetical protein [Halorientalis salina]|uniref:hypothetical protein n=1 Tax=Halorientalis salina TaxID=2932266 RepID=UPI0010AC6513|nr:hypothetical protein [Halorientalis salina]
MDRSTTALAVGGIVAVVVAGVAAAFVFGVVPTGGDGAPPLNESTDGNETQAFAFDVNRTEKCGKQCREMTVTVANTDDVAVENVTLDFEVYAGGSDPVWEGAEQVDTLESGSSESMTITIRVDEDGYEQIRSNFGTVTLQTTVENGNVTNRFEDERNVA